ncbi:MAG: class I SAM-dependent methyltransferase [Eubacteriales bacterium]|nr:class I SAM-dependent methyltransferase [Eubacteriales bacterium]
MFKRMLKHCKKPGSNFAGRFVLKSMNRGHRKRALYHLEHLPVCEGDLALDIGCGGGDNLRNLAEMTNGKVVGIDYSPASVKMSRKFCRDLIRQGLVRVIEGNVAQLPFKDNRFHIATAFETTYFWPDLTANFKEVYRILRPGGRFLIGVDDYEHALPWTKHITDMHVYTDDEMLTAMKTAGFRDLEVYHPEASENLDCVTFVGFKRSDA